MRSINRSYVIALLVAAMLLLVYPVAYRLSAGERCFNVLDQERVVQGAEQESRYLVYTDAGTFENTDSFLFLKFNSSDVRAELTRHDEVCALVAGWRIPLLSRYPNIIELR